MPIISNFPGGGTDFSDATAIASKVLSGSTFFSSSSDDIQTGEMVDYSNSLLTSSSYSNTGSSIRLNTPATGYMLTSNTGIQITYANLRTLIGLTAASQIVTGNTILGLTGTSPPALNGTATTSYVLSGYTFGSSASSSLQSGAMTNYNGSLLTSTSYSDTGSTIRLNTPNTGYMVAGSTGIQISYTNLASLLGLTSAKLVTGNTILGVAGSSPPALSGTATTSYVLSGYTFGSSASSSLQTGAMSNYNGSYLYPSSMNYDGSYLNFYSPYTGYMSTSTYFRLYNSYIRSATGLVSSSQLANGTTILGLAGSCPISEDYYDYYKPSASGTVLYIYTNNTISNLFAFELYGYRSSIPRRMHIMHPMDGFMSDAWATWVDSDGTKDYGEGWVSVSWSGNQITVSGSILSNFATYTNMNTLWIRILYV